MGFVQKPCVHVHDRTESDFLASKTEYQQIISIFTSKLIQSKMYFHYYF